MRLDTNKTKILLANMCYTTLELAENADITYQTVSRALRGDAVKPATAGKIARALGARVEEILKED